MTLSDFADLLLRINTIIARKWVFMQWPAAWKHTPVLRDITYLELIPIALAIYLWGYIVLRQ
jgi:hypothetical protein